jgi:DNA-binding winged helix-turn-helix (wHTH) protein
MREPVARAVGDGPVDQLRLDATNQCVWRGATEIRLTPKSYAVLCCLLEHPGQLVSKDHLLDAVWPDATVSDASLKVCVREIRRALGDQAAKPRFIETVHRRGYRYVGSIAPPTGEAARASAAPPRAASAAVIVTPLVGRAPALASLRAAFDLARGGTRQMVFVTGEIGIGKTALVETFLAAVAEPAGAVVARGRCLEHFGTGEAYLPLLEALGRICREGGEPAVALLRDRAPTWLMQMPWLIDEAERDALRRATFGGTQQRMLREITELLESLAADTPLVLMLDDLHWSDPSTLDALAHLAQRSEPARLLVLGTYRPVDTILAGHPVKDLKQRLIQQRQGSELALDLLAADDVDAYLSARLAGPAPPRLAEVVHQRTDGNALFMVMVVDELLAASRSAATPEVAAGGLDAVAAALPDGVRQMVERQIERFAADDVALLEAAALARFEFSAALAAAALEADPAAIEQRCEELARQHQWIRASGVVELPGGNVSACYRFVHGLYQSVLAQRVPAARALRLHRRIGEWLERLSGDKAASELAVHFEHGGDAVRAIHYLRAAARTALARYANREAIALLARALALVDRLPPEQRGAERRALLQRRGLAYRAVGDVNAAVEDFAAWAASARADGEGAEEVQALLATSAAWSVRDRTLFLALAEEAVERSRSVGDRDLHLRARGYAAYCFARVRGWRTGDAEASARALESVRHGGHVGLLAGHLGMHAYFANMQGDYAAAAAAGADGPALADRTGDSFMRATCQYQQCWALLHAGDWGALLATLHAALRVAERSDHPLWALVFKLTLAWWSTHTGDYEFAAAGAADGLRAARAAGHQHGTVLALLASGWAELGRADARAAQRDFAAVADVAAGEAAAVEWILHQPLHLGFSACALAAGDLARADAEARHVCALAAQPGERTYLALGHRALAEAAMRQARWDDADTALSAARSAVDAGGAPLAEWQVWASAATLAAARGQAAEAADYRARCARVRDQLAASLDGVEPDVANALGVALKDAQARLRAAQA